MKTLLDGFTQDTRLLRLTTALGTDVLLAECVYGVEAIDENFRFDIDALSTDGKIALKRLVGQCALLELLTASRRQALRPFHGYITAAEFTGANGGFARYRLRLEPWTAFLGIGRDSRVFQDMSVCDIVDSVFRIWRRQGRIVPAWRFDLLDRSVYPLRSLSTQYQESDLAFVLRLLNEEGLFWRFEHSGAPAQVPFGSHVLVIADHNRSFQPNVQPVIRFTQAGAVMEQDSLDGWQSVLHERANGIALSSWDYRARIDRPVTALAGDGDLLMRDFPGHYAWPTREHGERMARNELQALDAQRERHTGAGTVRTLCPGTTFAVHEHRELDAMADAAERSFVAVRVSHLMHNNFSADIREAIREQLDLSPLASFIAQELGESLAGKHPLYRMRVEAMRSNVPYRAGRLDEFGRARYPKPAAGGQQSAIVVGPAGSVIHTDRDHRIKVQFHWQRGKHSHSRLHHPDPDGHTGAPSDNSAGTWVRVATPLGAIAGANWGSNAVPRIGQEVMLDFLDGDIDRPVVIGSLYNGRGATDAQHNLAMYGAGVSTGNAPPWFAGEAGTHAHPAAVSGIKSQAMATSADGSGGFGQLVFDATAGLPRVSLQHHAKRHQGTAELNLGHLRHHVDNAHLERVGFGAELKTEHSLAVRAAQGMLIATQGASASVMDSRDAHAQIVRAQQMAKALADTARQHHPTTQAALASLPAIEQLAATAAAIDKGGASHIKGYGAPQLQLSGAAGIVALSAGSTVIHAASTSSMGAGGDLNFAVQRNLGHAVAAGISLFTYGKSTSKDKPNQETGVRLHAASGKLSVQSQSDTTRLIADKSITVASVTRAVTIRAKEHVLLTALGAAIRIEGGNITLQCPGTIEFKCGMKELAGPTNGDEEPVTLPQPGKLAECPQKLEDAAVGGAGVR